MHPSTVPYDTIRRKVAHALGELPQKLLPAHHAGRPLKVSLIDTIAIGVYWHEYGIQTKKDLHTILAPECSYKTLVVNLNRFALLVLLMCIYMAIENRLHAHPIKYTDATDVPVCLNKNAKHHQTMHLCARWGKNKKGWFYGLKFHLTIDAEGRVLSFSFTPGNCGDRSQFMKLNKFLTGLFVADCGYVSKKLAEEFYIEGVRMLITKPQKRMKKVATAAENMLYDGRAFIESTFRQLKCFGNFVSSLPRSEGGYFANYLYALAAHMLSMEPVPASNLLTC